MKKLILYIIVACSAMVSVISCENPQLPIARSYRLSDREALDSILQLTSQNPDDLTLNISVMAYFTEHRMPQALIKFAEPVFERARAMHDRRLMLYTGAYIAQSQLFEKNSKRAGYFLEEIRNQADSTDDEFIKAMIYNIAGVYAIKEEANYPEALAKFKAAYKIIAPKKDPDNICSLLSNIASIYYYRRDTAGFRYAHEAYDLSKQTNSNYTKFISTLGLAQMYEIANDYPQALRYAREAEKFALGSSLSMLQAYSLYGNIYTARTEFTTAEEYFLKALQLLQTDPDIPWEATYLGYGKMLQLSGRKSEAIKAFQKGLNFNGQECSAEHKHLFLLALSETYDALGNEKQALGYYKAYLKQRDLIFNIPQEKKFQELVTENARIYLQNEIQRQKLELMTSKRRSLIAFTFLTVVTVIFLLFYLFHRRQNKLYRKMVEYHHTLLNSEPNNHIQKERTRGIDETKEQELWDKLIKLMDEKHIYREKDISLEKIAEMLFTNRTYTSKVLNHFSGDTFYNFIHKRRIRDASVILSDPGSGNISLKELAYGLGYNSLSSFYRAFQKEIGCPPSKYRVIVQEIEKK